MASGLLHSTGYAPSLASRRDYLRLLSVYKIIFQFPSSILAPYKGGIKTSISDTVEFPVEHPKKSLTFLTNVVNV